MELDRRAETAALQALAEVAATGTTFRIISEEVGTVDHGAPYPLVLIDPVDGSLNAKQGIPIFALMLTLLEGPLVGDARVGFVLNLGTGEEWYAIRGTGAFRAGRRLNVLPAALEAGIELLGVESSPRSVARCAPLLQKAEKVRILGSMALSVAHTAAGSFDVFVAPFPARVFDMTASLLLVAESGGLATDLDGVAMAGKSVGLDSRSPLVVASTERLHRLALDTLRS